MDIRNFISQSSTRIRRDRLGGVRWCYKQARNKVYQQGTRLTPDGDPIFDEEWDVMIVLDACRFDLINEIEHDLTNNSTLDSRWSLGTMTRDWMIGNFKNEFQTEMGETSYVSANPHTEDLAAPEDFERLIEVWRSAWTDEGTVPPRPVTDAAIETGRKTNDGRLLVHYMQPHCPFINHTELTPDRGTVDRSDRHPDDVWDALERGEVSESTVWAAYQDNLELVLDEVKLLLDNVNAERVVITSDHGNAVGEWGLYGHPRMMPFSCLRRVPWIEFTTTDSGRHEPDRQSKEVEVDRDEQLRALGYR